MRSLLERLDRHWFAPARLADLALMRIALVGFQLALLLVPALSDRIGACPGCSLRFQRWLTTLDANQYLPIPALKVLLLPFGWGARPDAMFLHAVWVAAVVTGVCALVGWYARPSLLVFAAANTLLVAHAYSYGETHHTEALMTIGLWALAFSPSGAVWSLDALRDRVRCAVSTMRFAPEPAKPPESPLARWPLRLMQWLLVLSYFSAGISKLRNGGPEWFNGYTLAYFIGKDAIERGSTLGVWLSGQIPLLRVLSVVAIATELGFVGAVLLPRFTWLFLVAGAGLHAAIYWTQRAPFPQFIVLYVVFIEAVREYPPWRRFTSAATERPKWTVIYDGLCPLCIRSMTILSSLDLRSRLSFVDLEREWPTAAGLAPALIQEEARHAMQVISPEGRVTRGFFAFRSLARVLPPLWPALPLLYLPLADRLGPWFYDLVARSRGRQVCRAETCAV
jgi:predicted DCC family thiol-disulfide oxidoreductase YuxK/uncharacterized membrane protein YphA (DoxX/SURF4 family)